MGVSDQVLETGAYADGDFDKKEGGRNLDGTVISVARSAVVSSGGWGFSPIEALGRWTQKRSQLVL